ncbi:MAG TPA: hypothetical protein VM368_00600 [Flavisolibacter sp.]|nr:hypothetical protein [Flavisolibacter sp.]
MNTKKLSIGGITGGVIYFILGWLVYGMLLLDFMQNNSGTAAGVSRGEDIVLWAVALGNLALGFLLTYILLRAGISSFVSGFATGAIIGLLVSVSIDLIMYGTTNIMNTSALAVDVVAFTLISAITGGIIGLVIGKDGNSSSVPDAVL